MLFGLGLSTKIYIGVEAVDMRKGFNGLYGLVRDHLGQDPLSGYLFLFTNASRPAALPPPCFRAHVVAVPLAGAAGESNV
jgi:transposase